MTAMAAWVFAGILGLLALLQIAVAAGAPLGRFVWGGQHRVLPTGLRVGSLIAVAIYVAFVAVVWSRAGLSGMVTADIAGIGIWVIAGFLVLGTLGNAMSRSLPERITMTPVNVVLLACCLVVALS